MCHQGDVLHHTMNGHVQMWSKSKQLDTDDPPEVITSTLSGHVAVMLIRDGHMIKVAQLHTKGH